MDEPVVVGFDDSEHSAMAVDCAVREAEARRVPLRMVHAYQWLMAPAAPGVPLSPTMREIDETLTVMLADAAQKVRDAHPGLVVATMPMEGDPPAMLARASRGAPLLVVGGLGAGGFTGLLLGSVALRVVGLAECPVMVVRGGQPASRTGRIMVGVDLAAPEGGGEALEFAFQEAVLRKAEVYVIHVWDDPSRMYGIGGRRADAQFAAFEEDRREQLASLVEPWRLKYPGVVVTHQTFPGAPGRMLVDSTRLVDLLVVGGRARTEGHAGMRVGALAHTVLHHAYCPVVIAPEH